MLSRRFLLLLTLSFACVPLWTSAQQATTVAEDAAVTYLERNWNRHGLVSQADVAELVITDAVTSHQSGRTSVYLHQGIDGIPVIDGQMTVSVDENGHVFHAAGQLIPDLPSRAVHSGSGVSPATAANTIASEAGFPAPEPFQVVEAGVGATQKTTLTDGGGHTYLPVTAELVYIANEAGALRLAWDATAPLHGDDGAWRGLVDAGSGAVLRLEDVLIYDHFGAPAEDDARTVDERPLSVKRERSASGLLPQPAPQSSQRTGECYQVFAWPLHDPFHAGTAWPGDGRSWECDPFDPASSPDGWHDTDGDGTPDYTITRGNNVYAYPDHNNSNTPSPAPPDGGSELHFDFPVDFGEEPETYIDAAVTNLFYWNNLIHDVMVHYGFDEAHGNFQGHNYTPEGIGGDYVNAEAQDANTVACNNANFLTLPDGQSPRMQMYLGCNNTPKMDGSLDNSVVIHEYGHGVSVRLTGGPSNVGCLSNSEQMGEGWSDFYGLMLTQDQAASDYGRNEPRGVGTFLFHPDAPDGIRPAPYTTDFALNEYTYGATAEGTLPVPHGIGFVWATILWEVTWDLIGEYGFEQDITNAGALTGNTIMMNLVTEGLNLQPCSPGFVDGRDAILAAVDVVYADQPEAWRTDLKRLMWEGFARRGLGLLADQGSSGSNADNTESFVVPSELAPNPITDLTAEPDGDFVTLSWTAPDDDDSDVYGYMVRYASSPIVTETDWDNATPVATAGLAAQAPGAAEEFVVTELDFGTTYHFAVRSSDGLNTSDLSNSVEVTTLGAPVATVPTAPIEVTVPMDTTGAVEYTLSNAGPSTLRYNLTFEETTETVVNNRQVVEGPAPGERDVPERVGSAVVSPGAGGEPQRMDEGGPDAFGYRWIDSNELGGPVYDWIDITETGTELELGTDDYEVVDLPFDFPFYGNSYDWVAIQDKGSLVFEDAFVGYPNLPIPDVEAPNAIVAAYWTDLDVGIPFGGGSVFYDTLEDGRFVVSWEEAYHFCMPFLGCSDPGSFTFQVILEPSGTIVSQYKEIVPGEFPNELTIGLESPDGADGLQVVNDAPYVEDGLAIRFTSVWVDSDLTGGEIAAGGEATRTLTFDAGSLDPGTYTADMIVITNEPGSGLTEEYVVPLTLIVEGTVGGEDDDLAFEGTHRLSAVAPNPISGLARTTLEVAGAQDVRVELFDMRGRKVTTLFEGALAARTAQEIALDGSALAPGVYVLRIAGETFAETRRVTIVR